VAREDNRGFFVSEVSIDELNELTDTRCWLEEIALRRSIELGGQEWEEGLVIALYRLSRVPRPAGSTPFRPTNEWVARHNAFHDPRFLKAPAFGRVLT
jgi:DNA-binding GntR family transcriptional regulator